MPLPALLQAALDDYFAHVPLRSVGQASARLTRRYRDGTGAQDDGEAVRAYLAARLPATYAAVRAVFAEVGRRCPDFAPITLVDVGAGPGTCLWAAVDTWPGIAAAELFDNNRQFQEAGRTLVGAAAHPALKAARWLACDLAGGLPPGESRDLLSAAYVLNELHAAARAALVAQLWERTAGVLVLVEPGTPTGHRHILEARERLIALGAHLVAPCPHGGPCPLTAPDWCHFVQRLNRSKLHRAVKGASLGYEDEKYSYIAFSRMPAVRVNARVLRHPTVARGAIGLTLCTSDGLVARTVRDRERDDWKSARKLGWGDGW